jgi:hypothetical protein
MIVMIATLETKMIDQRRFSMSAAFKAGRGIVVGLIFAGMAGVGTFAQSAQPGQGAAPPVAETKTVTTEIITGVTLESVQKRIQAMGFECTRAKDDGGKDKSYLVFPAEGFKVVVFVPSAKTVELDTIFNDVHPTLLTINEWNRDNRFSRGYVEKDGSIDLEDDLDLSAGVTPEGFEQFIRNFRDSVARWAKFIVEHDEKKAAPVG